LVNRKKPENNLPIVVTFHLLNSCYPKEIRLIVIRHSFIEYHCVYQLDNTNNDGTIPVGDILPLCILRDDANGILKNTEPDTRMQLARNIVTGVDYENPAYNVSYCAAANQMGIHVRWYTDEGPTFYMRDIRRFDEDIDENTLVTYECKIGDGSPTGPVGFGRHGGTIGATLQTGKRMTFWTDPNIGVSVDGAGTNSGLYIAGSNTAGWFNCVLSFDDPNTILGIGNSAYTYVAPTNAVLVCMPNFEVHFNSTLQNISVAMGSGIEYYGVPPLSSPYSNFFGSGKIILNAGSNLNIHPGSVPLRYGVPAQYAEVLIPDNCELDGIGSVRANITFLHEPSLLPVYKSLDPTIEDQTTYINHMEDGRIVFSGNGNFSATNFNGNLDQGVTKPLIFIQ
jgi:hypothetical protein